MLTCPCMYFLVFHLKNKKKSTIIFLLCKPPPNGNMMDQKILDQIVRFLNTTSPPTATPAPNPQVLMINKLTHFN